MKEPPHIVLVALDAEIVRRRLAADDFRLERPIAGTGRAVHFGPEFPGEALAFYPTFLEQAVGGSIVEGSYVVVDIGSGEALGQVGTIGSPHRATVEIGYGINAAFHGRGIATAAVSAIVTLLASNGTVDVVTARTSVTNPASGRVLEKNGFGVTGREESDEGELLVWALATAPGHLAEAVGHRHPFR
ncbi:MAG: family acetyltransferase [Ilumatobacteraceae bacterium]|nr:family acetyltransferase [Ilumatobacteraceae bacterium]